MSSGVCFTSLVTTGEPLFVTLHCDSSTGEPLFVMVHCGCIDQDNCFIKKMEVSHVFINKIVCDTDNHLVCRIECMADLP